MKGDKETFLKRVNGLAELASVIGCTQSQLCLAWCMANKDVSVTLMGASKVEQIEENLKALEVMKAWTPDIEKKIDEIMKNTPEPPLNWRTWQPLPQRRQVDIKKCK